MTTSSDFCRHCESGHGGKVCRCGHTHDEHTFALGCQICGERCLRYDQSVQPEDNVSKATD